MSRIGWEYPEEQESDYDQDRGLRERVFFLRLFIIGIFAILLFRVYQLQQLQQDDWRAQSTENSLANLSLDAPRGVIYDRNGEILADNLPSFDVAAVPAFLPDNSSERLAVYQLLSELTSVPITNTVEQEQLRLSADPNEIGIYNQLTELYNESLSEALDEGGVVPILPKSITDTVRENSFAQYIPAVITNNVPITVAYNVEMNVPYLPGIQVLETPLRTYPSGEYTSKIIGYMGPLPDRTYLDIGYDSDDRVGLAGLESSLEDILSGEKGQRRIEVDWSGRERRQIGVATPAQPGQNVHLTIDLELQIQTHKILQGWLDLREQTPERDLITGALNDIEAKQGAVVALNPNTGEILAMVSLPTFDNNRFATEIPVDYYLGLLRDDYTPLLNHAIGGAYPPGSVYKLVTAAGALQAGVVSPDLLLNAPGSIDIRNRFAPEEPGRAQTFVCWIDRLGGEHGRMNVWGGLANSCDIYFYKINGGFHQDGEDIDGLGANRLREMSLQFGMGRLQGIELPAEAPGLIPNPAWKSRFRGESWSTGDDYNMAIGQGDVLATPLQIAQMAAVVANGGFLYQPTVVHHITDQQGNVTQPFMPQVLNAVDIDREYLDIIAESMFLVTQPPGVHPQLDQGGTAADLFWLDEYGILSAGKTGTAEYCDNIAIKRGWCRADQERVILPTHAWYVGYAPYENPEIVVAAFMFNGNEGSAWAAPVVRDVMAAYFEVGQFAPGNDPFTPVFVPDNRRRTFDTEIIGSE